jgi:hypothetical protein
MRIVPALTVALAAASLTTGATASDHRQRQIGKETSIPFASQEGLRDWERGSSDDILYVQDYRLDWYRVQLSGPCISNLGSLRVAYTTGPGGTFDQFSQVYSTDFPHMTCSVLSIKTSLPPPDRQHAHKHKAK